MAQPPDTISPRSALRELQETLSRADDGQIAEVVSLVDRLPERGGADALLAPLRARLQLLRPRRPLSLLRLLFLPMDSIIVVAAGWRRKSITLPRSTLASFGAQVRGLLGTTAGELDAQIEGTMRDDDAAVLRLGKLLWPRAAELLAKAPMPANWAAATGLTEADYTDLARSLAVVLREASAIELMAQQAARGHGPAAAPILACLGNAVEQLAPDTGAHAAQSIGMLVAVLIARLPGVEQILTSAGDLSNALANPAPRAAADLAIDFVLDSIEASVGTQQDLTNAAGELTRLALLLDTLEQPGPASRPTRKARAVQLRRDIDRTCRARFETEVSQRLLDRTGQLTAQASDSVITGLEATALELRRFEAAARPFGSVPHYERVLRDCARSLTDGAPEDANPVDVARLVEILQGPEAGLIWLQSAWGMAATPG
jgi:hypothetical protein